MKVEKLLTGRALRVFHVTRFSSLPVHRKETVGEHLFLASWYALMIGREIDLDKAGELDFGLLLSRALVHDIEESVTGDIVRDVKHGGDGSLAKLLHTMGKQVVLDIEAELEIPVLDLWENSKDDSLEGRILALADLMTVAAYALEGLKSGNGFMMEVLERNRAWMIHYTDSLKSCKFRQEAVQILLSVTSDTIDLIGRELNARDPVLQQTS